MHYRGGYNHWSIKEDWNWLTGVHKYLLQNKLHSLLKGFLGFLNFGHFLLQFVKLENSFEPSVVQYVIDLYSKVVVKIFNNGVTNANHIFKFNFTGLWDCEDRHKSFVGLLCGSNGMESTQFPYVSIGPSP
jgi:hypothetical protein